MNNDMRADYLKNLILKLSRGRRVQDIVDIVRQAARMLTGADGATFILKDQDKCYYVDEDAMEPLWKGKKFPLESCISGWAMLNKKSAVIKDIYVDPRIPVEAYRTTFVKSLVMVPINVDNPFGAIGNYWSSEHEGTEEEVRALAFLAEITSVALKNVEVLDQLESSLTLSKSHLSAQDELMNIVSEELSVFRSSGAAVSTELDKFRNILHDISEHKVNESQLKKVIYEISLKQLNEMDHLLKDFVS